MSRPRYEPIPQRDQETINLDNIQIAPPYNYNYNSGLPTSHPPSIASSIRTPSILTPSIPSSPPPSFHSHSPSEPGTPRPTPSTRTGQSGYAELWGVASSTISGPETEIGFGAGETSNDALATIAGLRQRVEWLEESIGKLLIEKDTHKCSQTINNTENTRDNCCITFTDASPDLERVLTSGKGNNCCVSFRHSDTELSSRYKHVIAIMGTFMLFFFMVLVVVLGKAAAGRGK